MKDLSDYTHRGLFRLVLNSLNELKLELSIIMSQVQDSINEMRAEVERQTTVVASVKALIDGFITAAGEAADDPEEIRALVAGLKTNTDALAAAVPSNTPAPGTGTPPENPPVSEPPAEQPPVENPPSSDQPT